MEDAYNYEPIRQIIQKVIEETWNLENFKDEMYTARTQLQQVKDLLKGSNLESFVKNNATFFYDILIEEFARWTIKKEIVKIFIDCICQIKELRCQAINRKLCTMNESNKFYIHKLIDTLSIYGDYDFQSMILELIQKMYTKKELKSMASILFPESEELERKFSEINVRQFDLTVRDFLQVLNHRTKAIFSICCQKVFVGDIKCEQNIGKINGMWIDINLLDYIISWYTSKKSLDSEKGTNKEELHARNWDLIMVFRSSIEKIDIQRYNAYSIITFKLKSPVLSSQSVFEKAMSVQLELCNSEEASYLINHILKRWLLPGTRRKRKRKFSAANKRMSLNRKRSWVYHESTNCSDMSNTSKSSSCKICKDVTSISESEVVHIGSRSLRFSQSISNILKDKDINITHQHGNTKNPAVVCIKSDRDYRIYSDLEDMIDNVSVCYTSEEHLQHIAKKFEAYTLFMNKFFPVQKCISITDSSIVSDCSTTTKKVFLKTLRSGASKYKSIKEKETLGKYNASTLMPRKSLECRSEKSSPSYQVFAESGSNLELINQTVSKTNGKRTSDIFSISDVSNSNNVVKKTPGKSNIHRKRSLSESLKSSDSCILNLRETSTAHNLRDNKSILKRTDDSKTTVSYNASCKETCLGSKISTELQKKSAKIHIISNITIVKGNEEVISVGSSSSHAELIEELDVKPFVILQNDNSTPSRIKIFDPTRPRSPTSWDDYDSPVDEAELKRENEISATKAGFSKSCDIITLESMWSYIGITSGNPVMLSSRQFNGFYLYIIFFHYDILLVNPELTMEINQINERYEEFLELNSRVIFCTKGESMDIYERSKVLRNSQFSNIDIPLIVDDGVLMTSIFNVCPENCKCGMKDVLLFEDDGVIFSKNTLLQTYQLDVDFLIKSLKIRQSIKNGTFDVMDL